MKAPYDWQLERDRQRFLRRVALLVAYVGALTLAPIALYLLIVGRFAGWVVLALAATIWLTAWAVERGEP